MRGTTTKRAVVAAIAGLALTTCIPSVADAAQHRAAPPAITLDFSAHLPTDTAGKEFGGEAVALDSQGDTVGGAVIDCADVQGKQGDTIYCTGVVNLFDRGQIAFQAGSLTSSSGPEHEYNGVVTGGTDEFEGITGEVHVVRQSRAVYSVTFLSKAG
jgi:hypothetical protein